MVQQVFTSDMVRGFCYALPAGRSLFEARFHHENPPLAPVSTHIELAQEANWKKEKQDNLTRPEQECTPKPTKEELLAACTQISKLSPQVQTNPQVKASIENYWANFPAALERLKIAVEENWRCNLTGVLVKALKEGVPAEDTAPPCTFFGWKERADEAVKRRLMEYSTSHQGDILVHLVGGVSKLWSQLRGLSWVEIECIAKGEIL